MAASEVSEVLGGLRLRVADVYRTGIRVVAEVLGLQLGEDHALVAVGQWHAGSRGALDRGGTVLVDEALVLGRVVHVRRSGVRSTDILLDLLEVIGVGCDVRVRGLRVRDRARVVVVVGAAQCEREDARKNDPLHDFPPQENEISLSTWRSATIYRTSKVYLHSTFCI